MKPTAAARTISLFTGKTDLEDPTRDGSRPNWERRRVSRTVRTWEEQRIGPTRWVTDGAVIESAPDGFAVTVHGAKLGTFSSMSAATTAAVKALDSWRREEVVR